MKFEELRKEHIVFSYRIGPDTGIEGDDGGFSIELYGNGNLRYCRYQLFDEVVGIEMYKLTKGGGTGIEEEETDEDLLSYPETRVTIYNEQGVKVANELLGNRTCQAVIQKNNLPKGLYVIVLRNGNKKKVIKYLY